MILLIFIRIVNMVYYIFYKFDISFSIILFIIFIYDIFFILEGLYCLVFMYVVLNLYLEFCGDIWDIVSV